jgi:predicted transcriptional regulator
MLGLMHQPMIVTHIAAKLLSNHIKVKRYLAELESSGLISVRLEYPRATYQLTRAGKELLNKWADIEAALK